MYFGLYFHDKQNSKTINGRLLIFMNIIDMSEI